MTENRPITVAQLRELLANVPQDKLFFLAGCDCASNCAGYSIDKEGDVILRCTGADVYSHDNLEIVKP